MSNVIRDIYLVAANLKYIKKTFTPSDVSNIKFREEYSEYSAMAKTSISFSRTLYNIAFGQPAKEFELNLCSKSQDEYWFFINGMTTSKEVASINELALEHTFGVEFSTLYNPTHGFIADLLECITERTFDRYADITKKLYNVLSEFLSSGKKIKIIAHSQGGIILSNLLKIMKHSGKRFKNIEVYTFASAADEDVDVTGVYQEHFGNELDFVSRIGLMGVNTKGHFYLQSASGGHLLNQDYLEHFREGKYCKGKSRLFKLIKT
jgi:hypothetical protein